MIVPDKCVKFCDPHLKCSREIPPEAIEDSLSDSFFCNNFQLEVIRDVTSDVAVEKVGLDVRLTI